jgi:hypothetical protein
LVRHCLDTRLGIASGRERVRQRLHALGWRLRRRRHRHLQAKAEAPAAFRAELEKPVAAWPEDWELLRVDEATVRRHPTLTAPWGVVDEGPESPTGDDQPQVPGDGAVAPLTGRTHDPISAELGQQAFAPCLEPLLASHPNNRLLVIHDRGAQPQGAPVEAAVQGAQGRLMLQAQPAYSPALHPQARIWTWLRRVVTHHHWCATLQEPIDAIRNVCRYLAGVKDQVRQWCGFEPPDSVVASL